MRGYLTTVSEYEQPKVGVWEYGYPEKGEALAYIFVGNEREWFQKRNDVSIGLWINRRDPLGEDEAYKYFAEIHVDLAGSKCFGTITTEDFSSPKQAARRAVIMAENKIDGVVFETASNDIFYPWIDMLTLKIREFDRSKL